MASNKDKVYTSLKALSLNLDKSKEQGVTSEQIADKLNIKRNVVSHLLNQLYAENRVVKINTRPVYFIDKEVYENNYINQKYPEKFKKAAVQKNKHDPFSKLIGHSGSLKEQVKMCKSAITYPPDGLPVLLTGNSGVGKSFMAKLIYDYAKSNEVIDKNAPFVIFNCAEYANNPELLSANLFGFTKGAFTGADKDKKGLLEEADGGYLFLDEVHRLPPEGQEKLFLFLDKGIYRRIGETGTLRSSNVRFIFATTEDPEKSLIKTFLRRIPLVVHIPALSERPIQEKLQMIYNYYQNEARNIGMDIFVSRQVIDSLLKTNISGNIGKLINAIKYSCAMAYDTFEINNMKLLRIHLYDLPVDIKEKTNFIPESIISNSMFISKSRQTDNIPDKLYEDAEINDETILLFNLVEDYKKDKINIEEFKKASIVILNKVLDKIIFCENFNNTFYFSTVKKIMENILNIIENLYGIRYYGNAAIVFSYLLNIIQNNYNEKLNNEYDIENSLNTIKNIFPKEFLIAKKMADLIEVNLDININDLILIYFTLYIKTFRPENNTCSVNAIIISHGYSTASSIANVANRLLGQFVFESFDMPIDMPTSEMMHKVCEYFKSIDTSAGIIILVDMGSLEEIYKSIVDIVEGDIGIINNITTQLALDVGNKLLSGDSIENIVSSSVMKNNNVYKFIKYNKNKKDAIITTCMTGIGTAVKIRDLFKKCISSNELEIIAYDYNKLMGNGVKDLIFKDYNIKLIIGTSNPGIEDIPYLPLEDLILGKGYKILQKALNEIVSEENIEEINQAIVKLFSLQNVIKYLTILNSDKIIDEVELVINNLEISLGMKFPNDLKISLYVHISCLIERLIMKEPITTYKHLDEFKQCHRQFINSVIKSFSVITDVYKIQIPVSEIGYIYDIIFLKIKNLGIKNKTSII